MAEGGVKRLYQGQENSWDFLRKSQDFLRKSQDVLRKSWDFLGKSKDFLRKSWSRGGLDWMYRTGRTGRADRQTDTGPEPGQESGPKPGQKTEQKPGQKST